MPSERSKKSAKVVPVSVVATMTAQYKNGRNRVAIICAPTTTINSTAKIAEPIK